MVLPWWLQSYLHSKSSKTMMIISITICQCLPTVMITLDILSTLIRRIRDRVLTTSTRITMIPRSTCSHIMRPTSKTITHCKAIKLLNSNHTKNHFRLLKLKRLSSPSPPTNNLSQNPMAVGLRPICVGRASRLAHVRAMKISKVKSATVRASQATRVAKIIATKTARGQMRQRRALSAPSQKMRVDKAQAKLNQATRRLVSSTTAPASQTSRPQVLSAWPSAQKVRKMQVGTVARRNSNRERRTKLHANQIKTSQSLAFPATISAQMRLEESAPSVSASVLQDFKTALVSCAWLRNIIVQRFSVQSSLEFSRSLIRLWKQTGEKACLISDR